MIKNNKSTGNDADWENNIRFDWFGIEGYRNACQDITATTDISHITMSRRLGSQEFSIVDPLGKYSQELSTVSRDHSRYL